MSLTWTYRPGVLVMSDCCTARAEVGVVLGVWGEGGGGHSLLNRLKSILNSI